ncbi:hypothetical protein [Prosthecomicrobium hirschii]|uniref:hypothetical protein n=1 Tax=Prosthecodimorpha hirschii TaxID=665126 RepID=UPI0011269D90|nr:hypothetical protein [Prosthecomicrobium hirschii]MCW1840503.1 hypothetical protein [Prosthecomicrobium hirschii]
MAWKSFLEEERRESFRRVAGSARRLACATLVGCGLFAVAAAVPAPAQAQSAEASEGALRSFNGNWSGSGTAQNAQGTAERLRCEASYRVVPAGDSMQLSIQCNSDNYKFSLRCSIEYNDGAVTGKWMETTRNVEGVITGRGQAGEIKAAAQGAQFSASLYIQTRGRTQNVTIRSPGTELTQISITFNRKG